MLLITVYAAGFIAAACVLIAGAALLAAMSCARARRPLSWDPIEILAVALGGETAAGGAARRR